MHRFSSPRSIWILGVLALAIAFPSCQSSSSDTSDPVPTSERTSVVAVYSIKKSEPFKIADSLTWSTASRTETGLVPRPFDTTNSTYRYFAASIQLKDPLKDGLLKLSLWSHGIRFLQADFKAIGASDTLQVVAGSIHADSLALALLRGLDSLKGTLPQTREGLLALYGTWILAGDARIQGFPDSLPVGLAADEVVKTTMVVASKTGKTLSELAKNWSLDISTDSATTLVLGLIKTKQIASKDSSTLFPPPPVRVKTPLSVGSGLRAEGASVGVTGAFEWDEGLGLVVFQASVTRNGVLDTSVVVYGLPVPNGSDRTANFEGSVNLMAKASAQEGGYMLTITAQDGAQHKAVSSVVFQVAAKLPDQPVAPRIRLVSPADKSTVPFETFEIVTTWVASTPLGNVDSVKIDGVSAEKVNDSTWQAKVRLEPTGKSRTIVAKAVNSEGLEAVATLELTRQVDRTGPEITWMSPVEDIEVDNAVAAFTVRIKATDPSGIDTILIAGVKPDSLTASGEYVRKVPLTIVGSPQAISVRVVDSAKNATTASKSITRANPPTDVPPKAVLLDPASKTGTVVPFETKSVTVRWNISDPYGIDSASVAINGKPATSEGGDKWSAVVDLVAGGPTTILLAVKNKNGVSGGDVASVTRKADSIPPVLSWSPGGRSVGFDSSEVSVGCNASDNDSLVSVTIGGLVAAGSNGSYAAKLRLEVGDNRLVAVATDRTGLKETIEAVVHRYQKLSIARVAPFQADTTVGSGVGSVVLSWKVAGAKSVGVGDSVLSRPDDLYTWTAAVSGTTTRVSLWATDSANHRDSNVVTVTRRAKAALSLSYGKDTLITLPDSVVIAATSEAGATLAWSLDGTVWTPFTGSFVQKTSGTAQVRAQVAGKDDYIASLKSFDLFHRNHAPSFDLASSSVLLQNYNRDSILTNFVKTEMTNDSLQYIAKRRVDLIGAPMDTVLRQSPVLDPYGNISLPRFPNLRGWFTFRITIHDNGGTDHGGIDSASKDFKVFFSDTVIDPSDNNTYHYVVLGKRAWFADDLRKPPRWGEATVAEKSPNGSYIYDWAQAFDLDSTECFGRNCSEQALSVHRGLCPTGWSIPDSIEWRLMVDWAAQGGTDSQAVVRLKSRTGWGPQFYGLGSIFLDPGTDQWGLGLTDNYGSYTSPGWRAGLYWANRLTSPGDPDNLDQIAASFSSSVNYSVPGSYSEEFSVYGMQWARYQPRHPVRCIKSLPPGQWR